MLLVLTADLHLGRASARLPEHASLRDHSAAAAWHRTCRLAVARKADAVLVAGDVFDHDLRYFEAAGAWEGGLRRLAEAGIPVIAVSGNHDHASFPAWVEARGAEFPGFHALGLAGHWETATIAGLRLAGWSFPRASSTVPRSMLDQLPSLPGGSGPSVGLVHADIGATTSTYHPVSRTELRAARLSLWVTGHVHVPWHENPGPGHPALVNPGSPQALDPGETGPHGVVLAEWRDERWDLEPVPLSSVRYDAVTWTIGETFSDPVDEAAARAALDAARAAAEQELRPAAEGDGPPPILILRPLVTGPSRWSAPAWTDWLAELAQQAGEGVRLQPEPPSVSPALPEDLAALEASHAQDALGVALRLLRQLDDDQATAAAPLQPLLNDVRLTLEAAQRRFAGTDQTGEGARATSAPTLETARAHLRREVRSVVMDLYTQMAPRA